jgi:hypothetical protein
MQKVPRMTYRGRRCNATARPNARIPFARNAAILFEALSDHGTMNPLLRPLLGESRVTSPDGHLPQRGALSHPLRFHRWVAHTRPVIDLHARLDYPVRKCVSVTEFDNGPKELTVPIQPSSDANRRTIGDRLGSPPLVLLPFLCDEAGLSRLWR